MSQIKIAFKCQLTADIFTEKVFRAIHKTGKSNTTALLSIIVCHRHCFLICPCVRQFNICTDNSSNSLTVLSYNPSWPINVFDQKSCSKHISYIFFRVSCFWHTHFSFCTLFPKLSIQCLTNLCRVFCCRTSRYESVDSNA